MSMMALQLCVKPSVPIRGGASESVFPQVEQWLEQDDHSNALRVMAQGRSAQPYRSVVDFLFCTVFPLQQGACARFYDGDGQPLRDLASKRQVAVYEQWLLRVLSAAHEEWIRDRRRSWVQALQRARRA